MKIHILYDFKDSAWGGGNQFLNALKMALNENQLDTYTDDIEKADVVLFNSHHQMDKVLRAKMAYPEKVFIQRMGSVFSLARGDNYLDRILIDINNAVADGTIFQSEWNRRMYHAFGLPESENDNEAVIFNAPNEFFHKQKIEKKQRGKIKLITTGWSTGQIKGFDIYKYLDEHLDFNKYDFVFIGNSPIQFKNIIALPTMKHRNIAVSLRRHGDIFITATQNDTCSNSLIEAIHCSLPVVARNSGGHPELVKDAGVLFEDETDVIAAIEEVSSNLSKYQVPLQLPTIDEVAKAYILFSEVIHNSSSEPKQIGIRNYWKIKEKIRVHRYYELIKQARKKVELLTTIRIQPKKEQNS